MIEQTGTHRRIVFGEVFGQLPRLSTRVRAIHDALNSADIQSEAVDDGRVPIWEKFIFLVTLAGFTGASRLPIGPLWNDPEIRAQFLEGCREVERVARAEGVAVRADVIDRINTYVAGNGHCWGAYSQLLPQLELPALWNAMNFVMNPDPDYTSTSAAVNMTAAVTVMNTLLCPSDGTGANVNAQGLCRCHKGRHQNGGAKASTREYPAKTAGR